MKDSWNTPDSLDMAIIASLQPGIEIKDEPFSDIAKNLGISQDEILSRISGLLKSGVLRRFGASVSPLRMGLQANGMVVCKVPAYRIARVGQSLSRLKEVTHCYQRRTIPKVWGYNLFFMVHGSSRRSVEEFVASVMKRLRIKEYEILFSIKELKKTSITL